MPYNWNWYNRHKKTKGRTDSHGQQDPPGIKGDTPINTLPPKYWRRYRIDPATGQDNYQDLIQEAREDSGYYVK